MINYKMPLTGCLTLKNDSTQLMIQLKRTNGFSDGFHLKEVTGEKENIKYFKLIITNPHLNPNLTINNPIKTSFNNNFKFAIKIGEKGFISDFITNF
ncbi:hypothetical protein [uncultured Cetobacterium sp.]|uniref:hypothetical protein n=1 Tax=uncultured Cetobacterium sp. TaxID=527638 RepID=UPI00262CE45E|nr:hypothetical protein [uncultured Cetobacterium sp.]